MFYEATNTLAENSNHVVEQDKTCIARFQGNRYAEARELREALQVQQRLRFTVTAMQLELKACRVPTEYSHSVPIALDMVDLLAQQPEAALKYRGVVLAGFLSGILAKMEMHQISTNLRNKQIATLQAITPSEYTDWKEFCPGVAANVKKESLVTSNTSLQSKYDDLDTLASSCVKNKNYTRANDIYMQIRNMLHEELTEGRASLEYTRAMRLMQANGLAYITFHKHTTCMAYWEGAAVSDYVAHLSLLGTHHRESLNLIKDFEFRFKSMAVPNMLEVLFDLAMISAKALGDNTALLHFKERYYSVLNDCSFMKKDGGLADEAVINPDLAPRIIYANGLDALECGIGALHLMLHLAAYEIRNGQLSTTEATIIFSDAQFDIAAASADDLENQAQPLFEKICGTQKKLTASLDFMRTYSRLLKWILEQDRKPSRQMRLFALKYFMQARLWLQRAHLMEAMNGITATDIAGQQAFDEANDTTSQEESALNTLFKIEASEEGSNSTAADEMLIQRILRHCHDFHPERPVTFETIDDAVARCLRLVNLYKENSTLFRWYSSLVLLIRLKWQRIIRAGAYTASETDIIISTVMEADDVFEKIRATLSSPDASAELIALVKGANDFLQAGHYRHAFAVLYSRYKILITEHKHVSSNVQDIINALADWSVKAKGKSLMSVFQTVQPTSKHLSSQHESEESQHHQIADLTSQDISLMASYDITIIDLVNPSFTTLHSGIIALVYRKDKPISLVEISLSNTRIAEWVLLNLDAPQHKKKPLRSSNAQVKLDELRQLITPFLDPEKDSFISKDTTIVWSLTDSLHRIPVHAISTGKALLIERNPIIYTQSLGLLHRIWKQRPVAESTVSPLWTVINPLTPDWESSIAAKEIAALLGNVQALHGEKITKVQALEALQGCNVFDFQGHAEFEMMDALGTFLQLGGKRSSDRLTVQDILQSVKLASPALCTLLACGSGKTTITTTDDVLSLPTAFHYAGASNVVSTLWPIDEADGARFGLRFYKELLAASLQSAKSSPRTQITDDAQKQRPHNFANLAKVMQVTMVAMYSETADEEKKLPYHWAGFFMQGDWLFPALSAPQRSAI